MSYLQSTPKAFLTGIMQHFQQEFSHIINQFRRCFTEMILYYILYITLYLGAKHVIGQAKKIKNK